MLAAAAALAAAIAREGPCGPLAPDRAAAAAAAARLADALAACADDPLPAEVRAQLPRLAAEPALPPLGGTGEGTGTVVIDRGRLVYRVRLADGRIAGLAVSSPTDRLLADGARVLDAFLGQPAGPELERAAALGLALLDPCWSSQIERVKVGGRAADARELLHA